MKTLKLPVLALLALFTRGGIADAAEDIELRSYTDELAHGNYGRYNDVISRYHEVAANLYVGVDPEEWDDSVHVRRRAPSSHLLKRELFPPTDQSDEFDLSCDHECHNSPEGLTDRDLNGVCATTLSCAKTGAQGVYEFGQGLLILGNYYFDQIKQYTSAKMADFIRSQDLNRPFMANFVGVGGQNIVVTGFFTLVERSRGGQTAQPAESCVASQDQEQLLRELHRVACQGYPERKTYTLGVNLPDGSGYSFTMTAEEGKSLGQSDVCRPIVQAPAKQRRTPRLGRL